MNKFAMAAAVMLSSLTLSAAAMAASNAAPVTNPAHQPVATDSSHKAQAVVPELKGNTTVVAEVKDKEEKAAQTTAVKAPEQKAVQEAGKAKTATVAAPADAKTGSPAPVAMKEKEVKK
ncbi:MAG: hypothetical protein HQL90_01645 [Magnetococcales bacterium]|nr:hypothetical protein [Magnetococcales bacterium]